MIEESAVLSTTDELSAEQRELFERLLASDDVELGAEVEAIPRRQDSAEIALSFAQQRLWFLAQLEPESAVYNVPAALRLAGPLDVAALGRSLSEVVRRHEVLRTAIFIVDGAPRAVVANGSETVPLPVVDLSGLASERRLATAGRLAQRAARSPFNLARAPLLHGILLALEPGLYLGSLTMHHIVSDGWSVGVLVREVGALYEAFRQGLPSPLPELPIQYADFAAWQRQRLTGELLNRQLAYWRAQLTGAPPVLALPTDRPRPAVPTGRGANRLLRLPTALGEAVDALGAATGGSPVISPRAAGGARRPARRRS
jgi:hypothetical protein